VWRSIPPSYFGGNIDNWRIGKGATLYYLALRDAFRKMRSFLMTTKGLTEDEAIFAHVHRS
jgi:hypothetical protein